MTSRTTTRSAPSDDPRIRVLCVDDSEDIPELISRCVALESDMVSVGSLHDADHLTEEVRRVGADVVLLDLTMPGKDPLEALTELVDVDAHVRVVTYSGRGDDATRARAARAGASVHVSKDCDIPSVIRAIRHAARPHA